MTALTFLSHSRATFRISCVFETSVLYGVDQLLQPIPALLMHVPEGYPPSVSSEGRPQGLLAEENVGKHHNHGTGGPHPQE